MKVLHLLQSSRFSGAENVVCQMIGIMRTEPDITMVYCSRDGQIREALNERGIDFVPVRNLTVREVKRVIRERRPDVIHAHDMNASFTAALACGGLPLISHIHNNNFDSRGLSVKSAAYLLAGRKARHIFWVSQSSFDGYVFHHLLRKKSSVLRNIIDIDALYRKMSSDPGSYCFDVAYVGRLAHPKNPQRLIRIFRLLVQRIPAVRIAVVGTGELEGECRQLARDYGLSDNLQFLGFQPNPLKILHDSKVMLMTSRWEGTPMCALEAMALGVPVVSTPADGMTDLICSGENGYLSDVDEELAGSVENILTDSQVYKAMRDRQLAKSKELNDLSAYRTELLRVYRA